MLLIYRRECHHIIDIVWNQVPLLKYFNVFYFLGHADWMLLLWLKLIIRWSVSLWGFSPSLIYVFPKRSSTLSHLSGISFCHNFLEEKASKISQRMKTRKRNKIKYNLCCHFLKRKYNAMSLFLFFFVLLNITQAKEQLPRMSWLILLTVEP